MSEFLQWPGQCNRVLRLPCTYLARAGATEGDVSDASGGDEGAEVAAHHRLHELALVVCNHKILKSANSKSKTKSDTLCQRDEAALHMTS